MRSIVSRAIIAALLALRLSFGAHAQTVMAPKDYSTAAIGLSAVRVITATGGGHRAWVFLQASTASAVVSCSWTTTTPTLWGAGTITLSGQGTMLSLTQSGGTDFVPNGELWCIAAAASTGLTATAYPR